MPHPDEYSIGINLGVRFGVGSHHEYESIFVKVHALVVDDRVGLEVGAELESARNGKMFGLGDPDQLGRDTRSLNFRWIAEATLGPNQNFTGLDAGSPRPLLAFGRPATSRLSYSLAVGQDYALRYPTGLRALRNRRGFSQFSLSTGPVRITPWYFKNDAFVWPLLIFGGATDLGPTHTSQVRLDIKTTDYIVTHALNMELVTPAPIRGRTLRMRGAEFGLYENDPSSPLVFGGLVYHTMIIRSLHASLSLSQGMDSLPLGCHVQRAIHQGTDAVFFTHLEQLPVVGSRIAEWLRDGMKSPLFTWIAGSAQSASRAQDETYRCPESGEKPLWSIEGQATPSLYNR
jgi:hypothetical protein